MTSCFQVPHEAREEPSDQLQEPPNINTAHDAKECLKAAFLAQGLRHDVVGCGEPNGQSASGQGSVGGDGEEEVKVAAADYNPNKDKKADRDKDQGH